MDEVTRPNATATKVQDINCAVGGIFSSDVGHRKIKILFMRSGALKKLSIYYEITADLEQWKRYWEAENPKNQLEWEFC